MRNAAADSVAVCSDDGNDPYGLIVTDLVALIGHVQASLRLIEAAIARGGPAGRAGRRRQRLRPRRRHPALRRRRPPPCRPATPALGGALDRLLRCRTPRRLC